MQINNYIGKRVYYEKKHLIAKLKEKPILYTLDILLHTHKDGEKKYLTQDDFNRIRTKYLHKTNFFLKIKWFFQTMYRNLVIWWKMRKFKTTKEISDYRMNICNKCPDLTPHKICKVCGCFMTAKTKLIDVECPLKKW